MKSVKRCGMCGSDDPDIKPEVEHVPGVAPTFCPDSFHGTPVSGMKSIKRWFTVFSNIAYPIAAILMVGEPVFTLLMLALGVASAYWHYGRTRNGADWDVGMMFVILLFLTGIGWGLPPWVAVLPAIPGGWALRMHVKSLNMEEGVGVLIGPLLIFGFLSGASLTSAVIVLGVALVIRQWVNHGLWHPVSAVGLSLVATALLTL